MRRDNNKFPDPSIPTAPVVTAAGNAVRVHVVPLFDRHAATICDDAFRSTITRQTPSVEIAGSVNVPATPEITCCSAAWAMSAIANNAATQANPTRTDLPNLPRIEFMHPSFCSTPQTRRHTPVKRATAVTASV